MAKSSTLAEDAYKLATQALHAIESYIRLDTERHQRYEQEIIASKSDRVKDIQIAERRHEENLRAITSLKEENSRAVYALRMWVLGGVVAVLLLVLGSILVDSFHFELVTPYMPRARHSSLLDDGAATLALSPM